ncbi:MAG: peptidoglycan-binding protein [Deltaproteobacteria bacterium]|nr:peptidoglycan-binding protein [Deltaproteobacteria bacterium]
MAADEQVEVTVARCVSRDVQAIEVVVMRADRTPAKGVVVALHGPAAVCRTRTRADGRARFEGLAPGTYHYSLAAFDRDGWTPVGTEPLPADRAEGSRAPRWLEPPPAAKEIVRRVIPGDCMISIAYEHGLTVDTLWAHNPGLHTEGREPRMLVADEDTVRVPPIREHLEPVVAGYTAHVEIDGACAMELELLDRDGRPKAGASALLSLSTRAGQCLPPRTLHADPNGIVRDSIPADVDEGELLVSFAGTTCRRRLRFGRLQPPSRLGGVSERLGNHGYAPGPSGPTLEPGTTAALVAFQRAHALDPTGELDEKSTQALHADSD